MDVNKNKHQIQHNQKSKHLHKRRRRKKRLLHIFILCIAALLLILFGTLFYHILKPEEPNNSTDNKQVEETSKQPLGIVIETESEESEDTFSQVNTATEEHHKTNGLAICMYHYVYDENNPPEGLNNNYIEVKALEEELQYLIENDYYFPSWEEVRKYIDGELLLPEKSIVLTFDDGAKSFLELGAPLFEKYQIPVTSFLITNQDGENKVSAYESEFVTFQSHSDNMHRAGGSIGHGGIFTALSIEEAVADLKKSIEICGHGEAFAYPYGDYTDSCVAAVEEAGFLCAVTTEYGRVYPGDNPLLLPRVRMLLGQSLESFISAVE